MVRHDDAAGPLTLSPPRLYLIFSAATPEAKEPAEAPPIIENGFLLVIEGVAGPQDENAN